MSAPRVETLLRDVNLNGRISRQQMSFDEETGFIQTSSISTDPSSPNMFVGFVDPRMVVGGIAGAFCSPITEYKNLPADLQSIDAQGKGVGTRVYNVREAFGGTREPVPQIDVYAFTPIKLIPWQEQQGSKVAQIARHGRRMIQAYFHDAEAVVEEVHVSYENAGAGSVLMNVPPNPEQRRKAHGVELPEGITAEFILIRDAATRLHKIGETTSPW